jgi:nitrite reductase/ring-hydroxylating ferredoxin subunit
LVIELKLDRELHRWITSTLEGPGAGSQIWTHAFRLAKRRTLVVVDFFVPGLNGDRTARLRDFYIKLYSRLYDEDSWMMSERQRQLDVVNIGGNERRPVALGSVRELRTALPAIVEASGAKFRIVESDGELIVYSIICPHRLGPLGESEVRGGVVECPWHGHRFDIRSGRCLSGAVCVLSPAPRAEIDKDGQVVLQWPGASGE